MVKHATNREGIKSATHQRNRSLTNKMVKEYMRIIFSDQCNCILQLILLNPQQITAHNEDHNNGKYYNQCWAIEHIINSIPHSSIKSNNQEETNS
jgi:hypothetical protein